MSVTKLDITKDRCPMTFVKTKLHLEQLEAGLRKIVTPEVADAEAKDAQRTRIKELGGIDAVIARRSGFVYSPPPGKDWKSF